MPEGHEWTWFSSGMTVRLQAMQPELANLRHFANADRIATKTLDKDSSPLSDRPQDYVACAFVSAAFRALTAAVSLILSGYSDSHVGLERTIWEMGITLAYINDIDPVGGAHGLLLGASENELKMMEAELLHMKSENQPTLNLPANIDNAREYNRLLAENARKNGYEPARLVARFARAKLASMCEHLKLRKVYDTSYAFMSAFAHGKFFSVFDTTVDANGRRGWILGPLFEEPLQAMEAQVFDLLHDYLILSGTASQTLGDADLEKEAASALDELKATAGGL